MYTLKNFRLIAIFIAVAMAFTPSTLLAQDAGLAHAPALAPLADSSLPQTMDAEAAVKQDDGLHDHQAVVYDFEGDVRILKSEAEDWEPVSKNMIIEEGDQLMTAADSHIDVAYDHFFLNIARIQEKTKAEFRSIEPTDVYMEDGTVFSALDGLEGGSYQISTPTAVAGVRGTTFDVNFNSATGALNMNVYKDLSDHQGVVSVDAGAPDPIVVTEGNGWDHESQSIIAVPETKAAEIQNFLEKIDNEFGGLREEGLAELEAPAAVQEKTLETEQKEAGEERALEEDSQEKVKGPEDGGNNDQGGPRGDDGGLGPDAGLLNSTIEPGAALDSDVDAFVDSLIPPPDAGLNAADPLTPGVSENRPGEDKRDADGTTAVEAKNGPTDLLTEPAPRDPDKVDYGKAMEFLSLGGLGTEAFLATGEGDNVNLKDYTTNVMTNLGVGLPAAQLFGQFVEKYTEIGGRLQTFIGGSEAHAALPTNGPMMPFRDAEGYYPNRELRSGSEKTFPNFQDSSADKQDFARIVTEGNFESTFVSGSGTSSSSEVSVNPFFNTVLAALQNNLNTIIKATLLAENGNTYSVAMIGTPQIDQDANVEKILGVTYINRSGQINASYQGIQDASLDGGGAIQEDLADHVYKIEGVNILACAASPGPEAGCA